MYIPKHYALQEWLPKQFYLDNYLLGDLLWNLINWRVLWTADELRDRYGPMIMNTWHSENLISSYGNHQYRGYRPWDCEIGAKVSQHKSGNAGDLVPLHTTAERIRTNIVDNPSDPIFQHITCIESGVGWLHFDNRYQSGGLIIIKP